MGSMASGFDDSLEPIRPDPLEPLEEVDSPVHERHTEALATPKAKRGPLNAPTDTIIARHVRNVEVPESLAKEYKTKGGLSTPLQSYRKLSDYTPAPSTAARSGRNMTLKEQSNTIERLSKENFDLKLKVMFLSDRLDKLSEEGIKEMISENVELRTSLAVIQRDNKMLRRRVKELEKRLCDEEDRPSTARSGFSSEGRATPTYDQANDEEIVLLREQIEVYVQEIERLRADNMASELDKRKLVETVRTMGDRASERVGENLGRQEEADLWKDLLEQETARREQADEENRNLRDEIFHLRQEMNGTIPPGMHHTTNIYNITRKPRQISPTRSRPVSGLSGDVDQANSMSQSSTLVEELRRESEKLRHENAELRREVGAQTSMLTSRNREKERLYQEIEDLKLAQRRGGPAPSTLDSLLDRSASRVGALDRPISRGSGRSRLTVAMEDPDREELENKIAEQRDKINELKFQNQEFQRELETCMADFEEAIKGKRQAEDSAAAFQEELENTMNDLMTIQAERDEALQDQAAWENKFVDLQEEAQGLVNELEAEVDLKTDEIQRLQMDLQDRSENFEALQEELRSMTESLIRLEDEQVKTQKRIEQLEQELGDSGKELEELEAQLLESNEKAQRLAVQQESSQGEIAFLREEQEGDKIRIGDLEDALANAEQMIEDERERAKELDQRLANERKQRELIANREKEEVQQIVNDLNREASAAKEEARKLRNSLSNREVEATKWKERLMELENNLREALGDLNGTRSSLLQVRFLSSM
jgi:chromosome segregation ATPase